MKMTKIARKKLQGTRIILSPLQEAKNIGTLMGEAVSLGVNLGFTERKQAENIILAADNVLNSGSLIYIILSSHSRHAR